VALLVAAATKEASAARSEEPHDDLSYDLYSEEKRTVSLFERSSGSVVHINTLQQKEVRVGNWSRGYRSALQEIPRASGSGFVWDHEHIVTNYHVIKDAHRFMVTFSDHATCEARLVGAEPDCDLAVLKLVAPHPSALLPLEVGGSAGLHVGQRVLAIGNPFGLDQTLTSGIVSGLGREMRGVSGRKLRGLVQTDAAINPGNSGGPLLDARGRLIGVNTMIASPSGAFVGVGFAIPVDTVKRIVRQLLKHGHTIRPWLGLHMLPDRHRSKLSQRLTEWRAEPLSGVVILDVEAGSPAESAALLATQQTSRGIRLGDEIVAVDGKKVVSNEDLLDAVEGREVGDVIEVTFRRRTAEPQTTPTLQRTRVTLGQRPDQYSPSSFGGNQQGGGHHVGGPNPGGGIPVRDPASSR